MSKNHRILPVRQWAALRVKVFNRDGYRCQDCGRAGGLEAHHVIPLEDGGSNGLGNLTTLCRDCHIRKHQILRQDDAWGRFIAELEQTNSTV